MILPPVYFSVVLWTISLVQLVGVLSAVSIRLTEGSRWQTACRILFFVSLTLVGTTAVATMLISSGLWLLSGITLSCMVLSALYERQNPERVSVWGETDLQFVGQGLP